METRPWGYRIFESNNNELQQILYAYLAKNAFRSTRNCHTKQNDDDSRSLAGPNNNYQFQETDYR